MKVNYIIKSRRGLEVEEYDTWKTASSDYLTLIILTVLRHVAEHWFKHPFTYK